MTDLSGEDAVGKMQARGSAECRHAVWREAVVLALDQDQLFSLEVALGIAEARLDPGPDLDVVLSLLSQIGRDAQ